MSEDREANIGDEKEQTAGDDVEGHTFAGEDREANVGDEKEQTAGDDVEGHALIPQTQGD